MGNVFYGSLCIAKIANSLALFFKKDLSNKFPFWENHNLVFFWPKPNWWVQEACSCLPLPNKKILKYYSAKCQKLRHKKAWSKNHTIFANGKQSPVIYKSEKYFIHLVLKKDLRIKSERKLLIQTPNTGMGKNKLVKVFFSKKSVYIIWHN